MLPHEGPEFPATSSSELRALAQRAAELARAEGLVLGGGCAGAVDRAIPLVLSPVVLAAGELTRRRRIARRIAGAAAKVARALLASPERGWLLDPLPPLERQLVAAADRLPTTRVAIARVDFFPDAQGALRALELNATIPALPGYADIAAEAFVRAVAERRGLAHAAAASRLLARGPSNARALLGALRAGSGRGANLGRIALCAQRGDPQLPELAFLARHFAAEGAAAVVVHPDELELGYCGLRARGLPVDLVYRHVFASKLAPDEPLARLLARPEAAAQVLNPVGAHLESKVTFAELSAAGEDPALAARYGLERAECALARRAIAWTRRLAPGPATGPGGAPIGDLPDWAAARPRELVLKRAAGYGGKAVIVGAFADAAPMRAAAHALFGEPELGWPALIQRAAEHPSAFVVQQYVDNPRRPLVIAAAGDSGEPDLRPGFVDYGAFTSLGLAARGDDWSGACRASFEHPVVNVAGGGAMVPLLAASVAHMLLHS